MATTRTTPPKPTVTPPSGTTHRTCQQQLLAGLSRAQRIGQLLMIGVPIDDPGSGLAALGPRPVGGVFLTGHYSGSAAQIKHGIAAVQDEESSISGVPLHISVDQEGGQVQSLAGPEFTEIPDAVQQGGLGAQNLAAQTRTWAGELRAVGVTLDLAPVADTVPAGTERDNPPIGKFDRQYGSTPPAVSASIRTVVTAMEGAGLGATIKHFPGLGRVSVNTDTSTGAIDDETTVSSSYLAPFQAGIEAGATAVMISSARYPLIDRDNIAAFSSKIIAGLLRRQLGFRGLVISDDLGAAVAVSGVSPGDRAVRFIAAGGDMVLTVDGADLEPMTDALSAQAADPKFAAQIDAAAVRVIGSKHLC